VLKGRGLKDIYSSVNMGPGDGLFLKAYDLITIGLYNPERMLPLIGAYCHGSVCRLSNMKI
jgi:hypothetical protein